MKRRRTVFAVMACCVCERTGATIRLAGSDIGPLQISRHHCEQQRAAFLFSMVKRHRQHAKDISTSEDELQQIQSNDSLINHRANENGFNGNIYGLKKSATSNNLYFATPLDDGYVVNGDSLRTDHETKFSQEPPNDLESANRNDLSNQFSSSMVEEAHTNKNTLNASLINNPTDNTTSFKASLLTGLEVQTAAHRTRLLSDLLEGVKEGVMNAVDTEKEKIWFNEEKGRFWQFWKRGSATNSAVTDTNDFPVKEEILKGDQSFDSTLATDQLSAEEKDNIQSSKFASRTITGLINALAQEVENLEVKVDSDPTTPLSNKTIHSIQIYFSRLGFQPLRMGDRSTSPESSDKSGEIERITADEAFDRIDVDQSGALDAEELASALKMAAIMGGGNSGSYIGIRSKEMLSEMAARLIKLYDTNGDGVVDREEYAVLVRDMAFLREKRLTQDEEVKVLGDGGVQQPVDEAGEKKKGWFGSIFAKEGNGTAPIVYSSNMESNETSIQRDVIDVTESEVFWSIVDQGEGSIVLEDMRLDLRRLVFGAIPVFKRVLPGGHLILKPFTATVTASFNRDDIMNSFLVDAGLRRLVARALSLRVRSVRDLFDGAVFYGRTWKLFEQNAPLVEVPKLQDVQFDTRNRLIITGRAKIRAAPDAPFIENGFKLRTKIGTRDNGTIIGLLEPEIAVFAECPKELESRVRTSVKDWFDYTIPKFQPLYTFIPLQSPFKPKSNEKMNGFNLGEDNQVRSIEIKNGKLCFEFRAILRPGRFLGSHYLAFTVPIRTMIITLDRVKEGMRNARRNKRAADKAAREKAQKLKDEACDEECALDEVVAQSLSGKSSIISMEGRERLQKLEANFQAVQEGMESKEGPASENQKSFFSRFVEGYSGARDDEDLQTGDRLSSSISNFFGSQDES